MSDAQSSAPSAIPSPAEAANLPSESNESSEGSVIASEDGASLENQVAAANPDLSKKEIKQEVARIKKLNLKVDGKEFSEDLPFDIPDTPEARDYMTKQLQMSKVSQKRMGEKAQLEKEVIAFIEELRKNPKKALSSKEFGIDMKNLAKEIIEEEIENSQKSPEQLKAEKLERELNEMKDAREKEKEEMRQRELSRLQEQEYERYDMLMTKALEGSDLPKSPYVVKKMADYLLMGLQEGIDVTPEDVLPLVRQEMESDLKEMFAIMPDEVVEKIVGKDVINRLRKKNVAKAKGQTPIAPVKTGIKDSGAKPAAKGPTEKKNFKQFFGI